MKLELKGIGKIKEAKVVIDGITVIAGANNTGKSTIGKVLYAIFHSGYDVDANIRSMRINGILNSPTVPGYALNRAMRGREREFAENILKNYENGNINSSHDVYEMILRNILDEGQIPSVERLGDDIFAGLNIPESELVKQRVGSIFGFEFDEQINNLKVGGEGSIKLQIQGKDITVLFLKNSLVKIDNLMRFYTDALYIDDPFVLHNPRRTFFDSGIGGYRGILRGYLERVVEKDVVRDIRMTDILKDIYRKINDVCSGDIKEEQSRLVYKDGDLSINADNLSAGIKSFSILKTLLQNGTLEYNGTVIFDEPEIHLHPEWQLKFAELIVLLHKTFNLHILLNTHSPYFLNAIEAYSQKYGVDGLCKYYLAEDREGLGYIEDVTNNTELIYKKLVQPLQVLEDLEND